MTQVVNSLVTLLEYKIKNEPELKKFVDNLQKIQKTIGYIDKKFQKSLKNQNTSLGKMAKNWKTADKHIKSYKNNIRGLATANNKASTHLPKLEQRWNAANKAVERYRNKVRSAAGINAAAPMGGARGGGARGGGARGAGVAASRGGIGITGMWAKANALIAAASAFSVTKFMDEAASIEGKLKLSADPENLELVKKQLYQNSVKTGTSLMGNTNLYASVARNKKELGMTDADALKLSDTVGKFIAISGGNANTDAAVIMQFSQSLASGRLQGDELRSILEGSQGLAQAIARSFGVSVGQLRDMAKQGKLTSKEMAEGLLKQSTLATEQFEKMPKKFSSGWQNIKTAAIAIGGKLNKLSGFGDSFFKSTKHIAENIDEISRDLGVLGVAGAILLAAKNMRKLISGVKRFLGFAKRVLLPIYLMYLVGEDILTWMEGGNSLIGDWLGSFENVKSLLVKVKKQVVDLAHKLGITSGNLEKIKSVAIVLAILFVLLGAKVGLVVASIYGIIRAGDWVAAKLAPIVDYIVGLWRSAVDEVSYAIEDVVNHWNEAVLFLVDIIDKLINWFSRIGDSIAKSFDEGIDYAKRKWLAMLNWIDSKTGNIFDLNSTPEEKAAKQQAKSRFMENKKESDSMDTSGFSAQDMRDFFYNKKGVQKTNMAIANQMSSVPVSKTSNQTNHTTVSQTIHVTTTDANAPAKIGQAARAGVQQHTRRASLGNTDVEVAP